MAIVARYSVLLPGIIVEWGAEVTLNDGDGGDQARVLVVRS